MNIIIKNKKLLILSLVLIILILFSGKSPEKTANKFLDAMYSANAKKCVSLMSDELINNVQEKYDLATKKLVINKMQDSLDADIESSKKKYGKNWKYSIEIIDSYEKDDVMEVVYKVHIKGKGFLKEKEDTNQGKIQLLKQGKKWYVNSF